MRLKFKRPELSKSHGFKQELLGKLSSGAGEPEAYPFYFHAPVVHLLSVTLECSLIWVLS